MKEHIVQIDYYYLLFLYYYLLLHRQLHPKQLYNILFCFRYSTCYRGAGRGYGYLAEEITKLKIEPATFVIFPGSSKKKAFVNRFS